MQKSLSKILTVGTLSIALFGCQLKAPDNPNSGAGGTTANNNSAVNTNANITVNKAAGNISNTNASPKPAGNLPKRIAFNKGANWGAMNITLAAGAAQKFIVGAKSGQTMDVEISSKETSVNLIKGKAQTTEDFGYLNAELQANGDYVFEIKNSTKKEIKTSVKVTIESGEQPQKGILNDADEEKSSSSDGEGQGADDGDRPPTEQTKEN